MTPERYSQISDLYHRVAALPHAQRPSLLDEAAAGDAELRAEVESLLAADEKAGAFLDSPALDITARLLLEASVPPAQVGRYRLLSLLGRGAMGDVYLAEDSLLRRNVAVKLLAPALTSDARAVARFEQEARAASSLNHPNIVTIYEFGAAGERRFLAMEFIDGRPLSEWVGRRMPPRMLLPVARQLAQALAVAHAAGIVHRDVKPANVMLRPDGYLKLLDFGVARLVSSRMNAEQSHPGLVTHAGLVIGTPRYMAPEQIRGESATSASDIFALGAVLYELATTKHPSESKATSAPPVDAPGPSRTGQLWTDPGMADLVGRMLAHDPGARPTAADVETQVLALERGARQVSESTAGATGGAAEPPPAPTSGAPVDDVVQSRRWTVRRPGMIGATAVVAAMCIAAAAALLLLPSRNQEPPQPPATPVRFQVFPPPNTTFSASSASFAISPDGRRLAFTGSESQGEFGLWIKSWDSLEARRIPNLKWPGQIFWSSDSRTIAFGDASAGFALKTIDIDRESVRAIPDVRLHGSGIGAWSREHGIVVRTPDNVLHQVRSGGEAPRRLTTLNPARGETAHAFPSFLPDGRHFLFLAASTEREHDSVAYLAAVGDTEVTRLFKSDSQVVYADPGYLLYMLDDTLLAVPFDAARLKVAGEPRVVAEQVERNTGSRRGAFSVSQTGVLAYRQQTETQLVWYHRDGRRLNTIGPTGHYRNPALSPDGRTLAVARLDVRKGPWDIWTIDVERNAAAAWTPETPEDMPVWSPDGAHIAFSSRSTQQMRGAAQGIYRQAASGEGAPQRLADIPGHIALHAWSAEGLVYSTGTAQKGKDLDLWRLPLTTGSNPVPVPLVATPFYDAFGQPSPDGRWMAYVSDQSGRLEVFASSFPSGQGRWLISVDGGSEPAWRRDGKELFYLSPKRQMMAVPITAGSRLHAGVPQPLFEAAVSSLISPSYNRSQYAVTGDGQRFLINEPLGKGSLSAITVVFNWPAVLAGNPDQ